ncbi:ABC transporter ATP-binding protein [Thermococcus sp. Bubb.Bath]|nr:ABC transporter ATP-binding protein [Thermococcus sp. Bubb.Bath]NJF24954.1 ABC transporter ATP-binding protein [Thermococcus sp. Bubb.Bath]
MIAAKNLTKRFGRIVALDGVNIEIPEGVSIILGPNGGGKSTFLKLVAGIYRPTEGRIKVLGKDPWRDEELKLRMGVSFDPPAVPSLISGREWLEFIANVKGFEREEVERVAEIFGIDYLKEPMRNYSAGMRKKLALAGAFIGRPELVILDEPLANLDFENVRLMVGTLKSLKKEGTNFLMVSHVWKPIYPLADFVAVLAGGKLVMAGDARELKRDVEALFDYAGITSNGEGPS